MMKLISQLLLPSGGLNLDFDFLLGQLGFQLSLLEQMSPIFISGQSDFAFVDRPFHATITAICGTGEKGNWEIDDCD